MSTEIYKTHLLKTLDCMTETARRAFDDLDSDARILRDQINALLDDERQDNDPEG